MKRTLLKRLLPAVLLPLAGLIIMLSVNACDLLSGLTPPTPVSAEARLRSFITDLNTADRSGVYLNFHPTLTVAYANIKPAAYWDSGFWDYGKYPFGLGSYTTAAADTLGLITHETTLTSAVPAVDIRFTLKVSEADVWQIVTVETKATTDTAYTDQIRTISNP